MLPHPYVYAATTEPTLTSTGVLTGICSVCGGTTTVTLPVLNTTDYTYTVMDGGTCVATGIERYTWKNTEYGTFYFDVVTATTANHTYGTGTVSTPPTCSATGVKTYTCNDCGAKKEETIAKIKHSWSSVWQKENAFTHKRTCECGEINRANHTYTDDQDLICNDCGYQRNTSGVENSTTTTSSTDDEMLTLRKILAGCSSTTGGTALSIALTSLSAAWVSMKKKKSDEED